MKIGLGMTLTSRVNDVEVWHRYASPRVNIKERREKIDSTSKIVTVARVA